MKNLGIDADLDLTPPFFANLLVIPAKRGTCFITSEQIPRLRWAEKRGTEEIHMLHWDDNRGTEEIPRFAEMTREPTTG